MANTNKTPALAPYAPAAWSEQPNPQQPWLRQESGMRLADTNATEDMALIMGIPAVELTPRVEAGLLKLIAEFSRVRQELDVSRDREAHLRDLADTDVELPLLNRRALMRELNAVLERSRAASTSNTFLTMTLLNGARIRRRYGHAAGRAALTEVAQALVAGVRVSDVVGCLGGYDLGVILTLADADAAARKAGRLASIIAERRLIWNGSALELKAGWGLRHVFFGDTAEAIIEDADRDLLVRLNRRAT